MRSSTISPSSRAGQVTRAGYTHHQDIHCSAYRHPFQAVGMPETQG
ncbi:hypothetical protein [Acrocarpospora corrugata]|nr:hypothetical protein [Acrocarpospora corrugata]